MDWDMGNSDTFSSHKNISKSFHKIDFALEKYKKNKLAFKIF